MSTQDRAPKFPRGFIYADRDVRVPESFEQSRFLSNLYVHPWLKVEADARAGSFVVVLGVCHSGLPDSPNQPATELLEALIDSDDSFFAALAWFTGRYAIIFGDAQRVRVVTDATAMRSVYYAERGAIVASHALLVELALGGEVERDRLPYHFGFPGNRTPYTRTKVLTPNTYLDFARGSVHRFWPTCAPQRRGIDEAARPALTTATTSLQRASMGRSLSIGLTAGLDWTRE